jgi:branched-chain amino acid transport system permease protein
MLELVLRIIVYGTVVSGIWALVASGFTLIFGVGRMLNFAHGSLFVLSAYFGIVLTKELGVNPYLSFIIAVLLVGVVGVGIYKVTISPIRHHEVMVIIVTLAIALLVEQILLLIFGDYGTSFPSLVKGIVRIGELPVPTKRIVSLIVAIITLILLEIFINKTKTGKSIMASAQDMEAATLMGINVEKVFMLTMFVSSVLAGVGGLLYSQIFSIKPEVAVKALIYAFAIVILGGLGSVRGSIVASFIVGYILITVTSLFGARWSEFTMLLTIIAILIVRPRGLFGVEE